MALDTEEWLVWLGVRDPQVELSEIRADIDRLKDSVGSWEEFEDLVGDASDYSELEQLLKDQGFAPEKVDNYITKLKQQYSGFSDFKDEVINTLNSYEEFQSQFGNQQGLTGSGETADGEPVAGLRVHNEAGTSYAGVEVPAGTTELFGRRIEISQQDAQVSPDAVNYSNQQTDDADNVVPVNSTITISADVKNPNGWAVNVTVPLQADGDVVQQQSLRLADGATETVSFTMQRDEYICLDVAIGTLSTVTLCWTAEGL